jgi:hypothetical protein
VGDPVYRTEGAHDPADRPIFVESDVSSSDSSEEEEVASVPNADEPKSEEPLAPAPEAARRASSW